MKGLLIKDFKLMRHQRMLFAGILVMSVFLALADADNTFVIGYMSFLGVIFTLSTLSYDEADNGRAFLFTLPVAREQYVVEKYAFGLMVGGAAWLYATVVALMIGYAKYAIPIRDTAMNAFWILPFMMLLLALMLPVQLRFGSEKGRIALLAGFIFIAAVVAGVDKISEMLQIDFGEIAAAIPTVELGAIMLGAIAIAAVILFASCRISIGVLRRKEL